MSSTHRTPTQDQQVFNLHHPHPVTFDFTAISSTGLIIIIPPYSAWTSDTHWHYTSAACEDIWGIAGHFYFNYGFISNWGTGTLLGSGPGHAVPLEPRMKVCWRRNTRESAYEKETVTVAYRSGNEDMYRFYRQVCSVNLDAEVYFGLRETPGWLRFLYAFWGYVPVVGGLVQARLAAWCLWIQLRVIYAKNDYWTYEGRIPYTRPWRDVPGAAMPPEKWMKKELESVVVISRWVRHASYWVGTKLLGMKESYDEYRPTESQFGENEEKGLNT